MNDSSVHLVYLLGAPGVGKSTAVRRALGPELAAAERVDKIPLEVWATDIIGGRFYYLGGPHDPEFPGTDRLSMSVHPKALEWITSLEGPAVVFGEGDRLGSAKWLGEVADAGVTVVVLVAECSEDARVGRAAERAARTGTAQDESWTAGRVTKVTNAALELAERSDVWIVDVDFSDGRVAIADRLRRLVMSALPAAEASDEEPLKSADVSADEELNPLLTPTEQDPE